MKTTTAVAVHVTEETDAETELEEEDVVEILEMQEVCGRDHDGLVVDILNLLFRIPN